MDVDDYSSRYVGIIITLLFVVDRLFRNILQMWYENKDIYFCPFLPLVLHSNTPRDLSDNYDIRNLST